MDAIKTPPLDQKIVLAACSASHDSLVLSDLIQPQKLLVILTTDGQTAKRLREELHYFSPQSRVVLLPDWETLPYDHFSPHIDLVAERLTTLWQIRQQEADVVVMAASTALARLAPLDYLMGRTFLLAVGQQLNVARLRTDLVASGYHCVDQVIAPGEFALRGGIVDFYPIGAPLPYRIDLFDDDIQSLRTFDPDTQKTIELKNHIRLLPAREYPTDEKAVSTFCQRYRDYMKGNPSKSIIYRDVSHGLWPSGIEYYLPLFFEHTATVFDYIGRAARVVEHGAIRASAEGMWKDINNWYAMAKSDCDRPVLDPSLLYLTTDEMMESLEAYSGYRLPLTATPSLDVGASWQRDVPFKKLVGFLDHFKGKTLIVAESLGRRETLADLLQHHNLVPSLVESWAAFKTSTTDLVLAQAPLMSGFVTPSMAVITESALYQHEIGRRIRPPDKTTPVVDADQLRRDLAPINEGDKVVHEDHGIGCYEGLVLMNMGEETAEMMQIHYAQGAKLYVPITQLHLISRYMGQDTDQVPLDKLGHSRWEKAKQKAIQQVTDTAAELLHLYAQRSARKGHAFELSMADYHAFSAGFGFEETPDQAQAITAVIQDMCSGKPMDRLVCGDVGFGKTEVALRAAFVAVLGGHQVIVLVPTTLLAEQHYQIFRDRFAAWPVSIREFSRFRTKKEIDQALAGLINGSIDIAIGTHRLIQTDVQFKQLGLVIIDEEHRFGVRQKEQLKRLRVNVDILTLTATPIPRTLSMALEGLRDFSMITTAPSRRLSIKTFIAPMNDGIMREAILRELKRGGQVFFLYNDVKHIERMHEKLSQLVPQARVGIVHGQLPERDLEQVMRDFLQQRHNVLICSTIIETGIDIPNANTIVIYRADRFGLAQLHQLRGRVGRSHHQAYAYLLVPDEMSPDAKKRLEAIQLADELGAGFFLAMQDLEIRGAGAVLGEAQSGNIQAVGFALYSDMLKRAVTLLRSGLDPSLDRSLSHHTEINLHSPSLLPADYCPDVHERLVLYKRLATCETSKAIDSLQEELIDRFGLMPEPVKTLIASSRLGLDAKTLGIRKIDASDKGITLQFLPQPPIDPAIIIQAIQTKPHYQLAGPEKLKVKIILPDLAARMTAVKELLNELRGN